MIPAEPRLISARLYRTIFEAPFPRSYSRLQIGPPTEGFLDPSEILLFGPRVSLILPASRVDKKDRVGESRKRLEPLFGFGLDLLSDSLAELGGAWALIGKTLAVDIDSRRWRAVGAFFLDLRSEGLGDQ